VLVAGLLGGVAPAAAHGFGQRYDLPVPLWLWATAAGAAVALSFVVMAVFVTVGPVERRRPPVDLLAWPPARMLASGPPLFVVRVASAACLGVILVACFAGDQTPTRNIAPTAVWVVWWVGFAYLSALVGDVWALVNPWAAAFAAVEPWLARRRTYPRSLGAWPAVVLFAAFAWIELVFPGRTQPSRLGVLIVTYSLATWAGMAMFGRDVWLACGDPFSVAFGVFARFAPTAARPIARDGGRCRWQLVLRPYGAGLHDTAGITPSLMVFVLLLLATVTFDGLTATPAWARLERTLYGWLAPLGDVRLTVIGTLGLVAVPCVFVLVYLAFARWMAWEGRAELPTATVARRFVLSLVPIAIAYHLAHYFTYLLVQGQLVIRLASDPFGWGWNVFGTARYRPDIGIVSARGAWYTAVGAIVAGHVIAVYVAHVIALREYRDRRAAFRSQLPMLVLMVGYTVVSLWIIAQPIVETR
jgi:hypothetical protein